METILVTGDIVLDCHLYGGVNAGVGSAYTEHLGGAALTRRLLEAAASAAAQAKKQVAPAYGTRLDIEGL
jgi:hypothetical protein